MAKFKVSIRPNVSLIDDSVEVERDGVCVHLLVVTRKHCRLAPGDIWGHYEPFSAEVVADRIVAAVTDCLNALERVRP